MAVGDINTAFVAGVSLSVATAICPAAAGGYYVAYETGDNTAIHKLDSAGQPVVGFTPPEFGQSFPGITRIVEVAGGSILVVGTDITTVNTVSSPGIVRLSSSGAVDAGWVGMAGFVDPTQCRVAAVDLLESGLLLVTADDLVFLDGRRKVMLLNGDGTPVDAAAFTFDYAGSPSLPAASAYLPTSAQAQPDGKIYLHASGTVNGVDNVMPVRTNSDGTLDTTWTPTWPYGAGTISLDSFYVQPDGKVVVAATRTTDFSTFYRSVYRLNTDGTTDGTFTSINEDTTLVSVLRIIPQGDGKLFLVGWLDSVQGNARSGIARLNADGGFDSTFGSPGIDYLNTSYALLDAAVTPDGQVAIAGDVATSTAFGYDEAVYLLEGDYTPPPPVPPDEVTKSIIETARFLASCGGMPTAILRDRYAAASSLANSFEGTVPLSETLVLRDPLAYVLRVALAEGLVVGDTVNVEVTAFARVVARLLMSGVAVGYVDAVVQILDAMVLVALADAMAKGEISETAVLSDTIAGLYQAFATILERLVASDTLTGTSTAYVLIDERVAMAADLTHAADLAVLLSDSVGFAATLSIDNGEYIAWVMNTEGDKPVSRYTQFPFNSMAKVGGRYMACDSTGLHWMDGNDDSGEAIKARLRAGMQAMGTRREKRLPEAFLYVRTDGELRLQVIQVDADTGEKVAGWFKVLTRPSSNARETRAKTGRGWKAVEFDIVLENIAGADFDLTSIEPRPLNLDRRTRG